MELKRELGFFHAVILGLSGAIGFEVFALLDHAYLKSGTNILFALILAGIINLLIMLNYCELSTAIPEVGGSYTFIKKAYKGFIPFILGCLRWLASIFGAALAAVVFADQLAYLLKDVPALQGLVSNQSALIAIAVVGIVAIINIRGGRKAGAVIVFAFIATFAVFIGGGMLNRSAPVEVLPKNVSDLGVIFVASVYVFPMFYGVRSLIAGAPQIKSPEKVIPKAILLSALLIIPLYFLVACSAVGTVSPEEWQNLQEIGSQTLLLNFAAERVFGVAGAVLLGIAGMVASLSALGTSLAVQSSILCGMSRDAYLPEFLLSVHQRFKTTHMAIIVGSLFVMLLSVVGPLVLLGYAASFASLLVFALVNLSLLRLRREKPYMERPFKTPLYPFTPIAGIVASVALLVFPVFLGETKAIGALGYGAVLTGVVLMTYYLRMIGRYRLQIAVGGAGLGTGIFLLLLTCLSEVGLMQPTFPYLPNYLAFLIEAVIIVAGILNITAQS